MNNPLRILQTLDRHLTAPAELTLFGRAALALGYSNSPAAFAATHDVDAILPMAWLDAHDRNPDFWEAQQRTNAELEPEGSTSPISSANWKSSSCRTGSRGASASP
jgi:hypothetical protein